VLVEELISATIWVLVSRSYQALSVRASVSVIVGHPRKRSCAVSPPRF
jgi:hypothetical protein